MHAVMIKLRFAIGSLVCIIAGASEIRGIVQMCASSLWGLAIMSSVATVCSSLFWGARMVLIVLGRPLVVPGAVTIVVCNSSVSALKCAFGLRLGTW